MPTTDLPLVPGTLPAGYCPTGASGFQDFYNKMFELGVAQLTANYTLPNYGDTTPAPEDQTRPWIRTVAGAPDRTYIYYAGAWMAKHPVPASSSIRHMWVGEAADIVTYDEGEAGAVTTTTGAFWEIDTAFAARSPMGVGTLPLSGQVLAVNDTYGVDQRVLDTNDLPAHTHPVTLHQRVDLCDGCGSSGFHSGTGTNVTVTDAAGANTTTNDPVVLVHPVIAVYVIKRTVRQYYRV